MRQITLYGKPIKVGDVVGSEVVSWDNYEVVEEDNDYR